MYVIKKVTSDFSHIQKVTSVTSDLIASFLHAIAPRQLSYNH